MRKAKMFGLCLCVLIVITGHVHGKDGPVSGVQVSATGLIAPCLVEGAGNDRLGDTGATGGLSIVGTIQPCPLGITTTKVVTAESASFWKASNDYRFVEVVILCKVPKGGRVIDFKGIRLQYADKKLIPLGLSVPTLKGYDQFKNGMGVAVAPDDGALSSVGNCKFSPGLVIGVLGAIPSESTIRLLFQIPTNITKASLVFVSE